MPTTKKNGSHNGGSGQVRFASDDGEQHSTTSPPSSNHPPPPPSPPPPDSSAHTSASSPPPPLPAPSLISKSPKYRSTELHGNMTRVQVDRDPLFYYEVVSVLGVGSMGSVAKVRKRDAVVGGSARKIVQKHLDREKKLKSCFQIPVLGSIFQSCLKLTGHDQDEFMRSTRSGVSDDADSSSSHSSIGGSLRGCMSSRSSRSSILQPRANLIEDYNDGHGEPTLDSAATTSSSSKGIFYAMKSIHLSRVTDPTFIDELKNEIEIMKTLDHPHVVKAMETYEHRNQIFIVMELNYGGDLYARDPYTEEEAARITTSILSAIAYIHSKNIIHRDLKYENILFTNNSPKAEIKLIDFGLSAKFGNEDLTEGVGTIYTMAPEVLKGKYTKQADVWSIGVIAYMLLSSQMPFYGRKRRHIVEQIMKGEFQFKGRRWKRVSAQSREFIRDLLVVDPEERLDAESALRASWLNKRYNATVRNPYQEEVTSAQRSMVNYTNYNKLKKVALMVIAHKSTSEEIGILRKVFEKYDTQKDGQLCFEEFQAAIADCGFSPEHSQQIFDAVDLDGSGKIRYTEFLAATIEAHGAISEERLAEAFDRIDADDSGFISKENLRDMLGAEFPDSEIDSIIDGADITRDGKISYSEFLHLWEEKKEDNRRKSMRDITMLMHTDSNRSELSDDFSEASTSENADADDYAARGNFLKEKINSQRSYTAEEEATATAAIVEEPPSAAAAGGAGGKHVGFQETVQTIPAIVYNEGNDDDDDEKVPLVNGKLAAKTVKQ